MAASLKRTLSYEGPGGQAQLPRGRHGLSRQFVLSNQRERIIAAMIQAVGEKGYAEATVADVISLAELSRKTFYDHFKSKEDCFLEAYDTVMSRLAKMIVDAYDKADSWSEGLRAALKVCLDLFSKDPALARMSIVEILAAGPQALERYERVMRYFVPLLEVGRGESTHGEEIPAKVAEEVIGGIVQTLYMRVLEGRISTLHELDGELLYFALVPFLGHDRALQVAYPSGT